MIEAALEEARLVLAQKPKSYVGAARNLAAALLAMRDRELFLLAQLRRLDPAYAASDETDGAPAEAR